MLKLLVGTTLASASAFSMGGAPPAAHGSRAAVQMASFYDFSATTIDGKKVDFSSYKGKPVLILNIASL
jgi:glutathione peroxidase